LCLFGNATDFWIIIVKFSGNILQDFSAVAFLSRGYTKWNIRAAHSYCVIGSWLLYWSNSTAVWRWCKTIASLKTPFGCWRGATIRRRRISDKGGCCRLRRSITTRLWPIHTARHERDSTRPSCRAVRIGCWGCTQMSRRSLHGRASPASVRPSVRPSQPCHWPAVPSSTSACVEMAENIGEFVVVGRGGNSTVWQFSSFADSPAPHASVRSSRSCQRTKQPTSEINASAVVVTALRTVCTAELNILSRVNTSN